MPPPVSATNHVLVGSSSSLHKYNPNTQTVRPSRWMHSSGDPVPHSKFASFGSSHSACFSFSADTTYHHWRRRKHIQRARARQATGEESTSPLTQSASAMQARFSGSTSRPKDARRVQVRQRLPASWRRRSISLFIFSIDFWWVSCLLPVWSTTCERTGWLGDRSFGRDDDGTTADRAWGTARGLEKVGLSWADAPWSPYPQCFHCIGIFLHQLILIWQYQ